MQFIRRFVITFLLCSGAILSSNAQSYQFEHLINQTYTPLTDSQGHIEHPFNGGVAQLLLAGGPYGNINTFGTTFNLDTDTVRINVDGNIDFFNDTYFAVYDGAMLPIRSIDNNSYIRYFHINTADQHKLVFQWENCGFDGLSDSYTINFQMHFDLYTGDFWVQYGPTSTGLSAQPQIGLALLDPGLTGFYEVHFLNGPSSSPSENNFTFDFLNDVPTEGNVYRWNNLNSVDVENITSFEKSSIYPNPAKDFVSIPMEYQYLKVFDLLGKEVLSIDEPIDQINVSALKSGVYYVHITTNSNQQTSHKLIVQ